MTQGRDKYHESGWRDSALQPPRNLGALPKGHRSAENRATAQPAGTAPQIWWFLLVVAVPVVAVLALAALAKLDNWEKRWDADEYCANVYAGKIPDYRETYWQTCDGPRVKEAVRSEK